MRHVIPAALLGASLALSGCSSVDDVSSYDITGNTLAAIGLASPDRETPEDPKPRGPLVVPGSRDNLPPPRESVAANDPNWPRDAEEREEAIEAEAERRNAEYLARLDDPQEASILLSREELAGGTGPTPGDREPDELQRHGTDRVNPTLSTQELNEQNERALELARQQSGQGSVERRYLIDPPTEYRQLSGAEYEGRDEMLDEARQEKEKTGLSRLWPF